MAAGFEGEGVQGWEGSDPGYDPTEPLAWPPEAPQLVDDDAPWSFAMPGTPADMIANGEARAFWVAEFGDADGVAWEVFLRAFSRRFNVGAVGDDVSPGAFAGLRDGIFKSESAWAGERRVVSVCDVARVFPPQESVMHRAASLLAGVQAGVERKRNRFYGYARDHNPMVFKGRSREMDRLMHALVDNDTRVFVISGPAGCGKSAAASFLGFMVTDPTLEAHATACPGGCLRVDLQNVQASEPDCLLAALAAALRLAPGSELEPAVRGFCRDRPGRFLVVLDNVDSKFMRDPAFADTVAELLRLSEHCRVLVTSRSDAADSSLAVLSGCAFDVELNVALPPALSPHEAGDLVAVLAPRFTRTGQTDALCSACGNAPFLLTLACRLLDNDPDGERFSKLLAALEDGDPEGGQSSGPGLPSVSAQGTVHGGVGESTDALLEPPFFRLGEGDHAKYGPASLSGDGKAETILRLIWDDLSEDQRGHLTALSVFPGSFSSAGAALVLGCHMHEVDRLLVDLKAKDVVTEAPTPLGAACTGGRRYEVVRPVSHYAARMSLAPDAPPSIASGAKSRFVELVSRTVCSISRCVPGGPVDCDGSWVKETPLLLFDSERPNVDEVIRLATADAVLSDTDSKPLARLLANNVPLLSERIAAGTRLALASAVLGMAQRLVQEDIKLEEGTMLELIGKFHAELGHIDASSEFLRLAHDFLARQLGPAHPGLAACLDALAATHAQAGCLPDALEALHASLEIRKEFFGPSHPETAKALQAIAAVARGNKEPVLARELLEESLACVSDVAQERVGGAHVHPDFIRALHLLGSACEDLADWDSAARHYGRAISGVETLFPVSPRSADAFEWLAALYEARGMHVHALDYMGRALVVRRRVFGVASHPVATTLVAMSVMHLAREAPRRALRLLDEALEIQCRLLDEEDPDLASTYNNVGIAYFLQRRYKLAHANFERALAIRTRALGSESEEAAHCLSNLGMCACATRNYTHALNTLQSALAIFQSLAEERGQESSDVARTLNNLGVVYAALKDGNSARKCHAQSLAIWGALGQPSGPAAADVEVNLGDLEAAEGDHARALPHYLQCLKARESTLGKSHSATVSACVHVAETYGQLGKGSLAIAILEKASDAISVRKRGMSGRHAEEAARIATATGVQHALSGHYCAAEHACNRAVAILEAAGIRGGAGMVRALECAGCCWLERGDAAKAEPLFTRALAACQDSLVQDSSAGEKYDASSRVLLAAPARWGLALTRLAQGDVKAAAAGLDGAYAELEGALGASHPATQDVAKFTQLPAVAVGEDVATSEAPEETAPPVPRGAACASFARNARMLSIDASVGFHQHRVSR